MALIKDGPPPPPPTLALFYTPISCFAKKTYRSSHSVIKTKQSKKCVCVCVQMWLFVCVTFCYAFKKEVSFLVIQKIKLVISNMMVTTNAKSCYYNSDVGFFLVLLLSTRMVLNLLHYVSCSSIKALSVLAVLIFHR